MANIVRFDPFSELSALQRRFFNDDWISPATQINIPTTDIYMSEDGKQMTVEVHLPNFNENDVNISVDDGALEIQAERREQKEDKQRNTIVRESASSYYRRILLPDRADGDHIEASLDNGVLKVNIPMTPLPEPKKISVKASKSSNTNKDKQSDDKNNKKK